MQQSPKIKVHPFSLSRIENVFFLNGITALLGWNAVLGSLDYFSNAYPGYNVYLYFPIPVFIAYAVTGVLFNQINKRLNYESLVKIGIVSSNVCLIVLVLISLACTENFALGFWLSMLVCFFIGVFNNFAQLSFFGMINYFGGDTVSKFTIGTAASGLMLILLRAIVTGAFSGSDNKASVVPILIYFLLSIAFNSFDLYLNIKLFKSPEYIQKIEKTPSQSVAAAEQSLISANNNPYHLLLWESFRATVPYPLFIFFNFVITFMLFPDLTLAVKTSLDQTWGNIVMLLMYNIGDFAGKLVGDFRGSFNARSILFLFFSRLFFFYTIPLMDKQFTQEDHVLNNDFFPFFNQVLFALTNGLVINGSFILAFEKAPDRYKKYAGVLCGILLQFGIMVGSFLAIPVEKIVSPDI